MQNQEHLYEEPEQAPIDGRARNIDPREQRSSGGEEGYSTYEEGYRGSQSDDIWTQGEKLRDEPIGKSKKSMNWLFSLVVLVCLFLIGAGILGIILVWLSWLIVMLLILAGAVAFILNWRVVEFPLPERRFTVSEHAHLDLHNAAGRVSIVRGEPDAITVNAIRRASGFGINPDQMQVFYDQRGDGLRISTKVQWNIFQFGMRSVYFQITVPENCDIDLNNGSGRLFVQGASGTMRLKTGSGSVELSDLRGQIAVKTGSGGIKANNLQGRMDIVTGSGGVEGYGLRGKIELKTGSGGIRLAQSRLAGTSRLTTGSGGIVYDGALDPQGDSVLKTGSGGIDITLPANAAFSLDARTGSGGVANEFGNSEVGSSPRAQLRLKTGSGGIRIHRGFMLD